MLISSIYKAINIYLSVNGVGHGRDVLYFDSNLEETIRKAKKEALQNLAKHGNGQNVQAYYLRGNLTVTPLF